MDHSSANTRSTPIIPDYALLRQIGSGAYGEVWLARGVTPRYRAVKIVYRATFDHDRPFDREFEGVRKFESVSRQHESHLEILHVGRSEDSFYYVMELADDQLTGGQIDPAQYAPRTLKSDLLFRGRLAFEDCVRIGIDLAAALHHLHVHGLVHRDVKPSNIIFVNNVPKLADIGLVTGVNATRSIVGTDGFSAPEGTGTVQADLYSLGKVLYECASGKDRQDFPELPTQLRELPDREGLMELNTVIARACRHDPKDRYQSAARMREDLELLKSGKSLARLHRAQKRLRWGTRVAAGLVFLTILLSFGWVYHARHNRVLLRLANERARLAEENLRLAEFERLKLRQENVIKSGEKTLIILGGPITNLLNGHHYYLLDCSSPSQAELFSRNLGGHLATIRSQDEQDWIFRTFGNWNGLPRNLSIGLYHPDPEHGSITPEKRRREFRWRSGEPLTYMNWGFAEPNSWEGNIEGHVHIWAPSWRESGRWNDIPDIAMLMGIGLYGVTEVIPLPDPEKPPASP